MRRLRTLLWTAFSILVVFAAVLVGIGKLLMPYSDRYQPQLEGWLSQEFGRPVTLESFSGEWRAFGPRLTLSGLRIDAQNLNHSSEEMLISEAALELKPLSLLIPGRAFYSFLVIGADLKLVRDIDGKVQLSGLGLRGGTGAGLDGLVGLGELRLEDSRLVVFDESWASQIHFSEINARLQLDDESLAISLESKLTDPSSARAYGSVEATAVAELGIGTRLQNANWHVSASDLLLVYLHDQLPDHPLLPRQGNLRAEFWGGWARNGPWNNKGTVELKNAWLSNGQTDLMLDRASSQFSFEISDGTTWQLDTQNTYFSQGESQLELPGLVVARDERRDVGLWFEADYLPLENSLPIARQFAELLEIQWPERLPATAAGSLSAVKLVLASDWSNRWLSGSFRELAVANWQNLPGIAGLSGEIRLDSGQGNLQLNAPFLQIDWPGMFNSRLEFSFPECSTELQLGPDWQIDAHGCQLFNEHLSAQGDVRIIASDNRPAVDINVEVLRLDIEKLSPYWPEGIMSEAVTAWLRENLRSGHADRGRLQIHGDMDNWPFTNGAGRFEAWVAIENGELSFAEGWPALESVQLLAEFIGPGMRVEGQVGSFGGVPVNQATARIETFGDALLEVDFAGRESVSRILDLVQKTPLLPAHETDLSEFEFAGSLNASGRLELPLGSRSGELQLRGKARVSGGGFFDHASGVRVESVSGPFDFDEQHVWAENLAAVYETRPAKLGLQVGGDDEWGLQASLKGSFDVYDLLPDFLLEQKEIIDNISGRSDWVARVLVPAKPNEMELPVLLTLDSGLQGLVMDLPAPMRKKDYEIWPFSMQYPLTGESRLLRMELNEEIFVAAEIVSDPGPGDSGPKVLKATVSLGQVPSQFPGPGNIQIKGTSRTFDLDAWVDLVVEGGRSGGGLGGLQLGEFNILADKLVFLDRIFEQVGLDVAVTPGGIRAEFAASDIDGYLTFTEGDTGRSSLNAEFERLALAKPLSEGVDTETNPAELPELHLFAQSFRYAGLEMGETRIEAYPTSTGFHFEKVEANSESLSVRASGDWSLLDHGQRSDFDIMMTAESLGDLLHSLDFSSSLEGGQTVLQFDAWWPGSPAAFALARLNGDIEFSISRGQITNASTGSGKVLGLLSIQSLPRRLSLDFRDVFDSGFGFETASGTFHMENGTASTDDVKLSSSAASITLQGSTDLVKQEYNQQMTVMPGLGNTLPVIGAIAAGPGGAAAGLALQGLLHEQLGKATQVQYTITGSWDEPIIEPIVKEANEDSSPEQAVDPSG